MCLRTNPISVEFEDTEADDISVIACKTKLTFDTYGQKT